jgi:hypothetical protein
MIGKNIFYICIVGWSTSSSKLWLPESYANKKKILIDIILIYLNTLQ